MKRIYGLFLALVLLSAPAFAQNINTAANFPDPAFRSIVEGVMGVSAGGTFSATQTASVTGLIYAYNSGITDISGIEFFPNLDTLYVHFNSITSADLSQNTALRRLFFSHNHLTSLDLSANTALEEAYLQSNYISSLTLPQSAPISRLMVHYNDLTDVSNIPSMTNLDAGDLVNISWNYLDLNDSEDVIAIRDILGSGLTYSPQRDIPDFEPIPANLNINTATAIPDPVFRSMVQGLFNASPTDIITIAEAAAYTGLIYGYNAGISDLTGIEYFTNLDTLYVHFNSLSSVDLSQNTALRRLFISHNDLTSLDLSNNTLLENIYVQSNELTSLTLPTNAPIQTLMMHYNHLTDVADLLTLTNLGAGDTVNISWNDLDFDDSPDVIGLRDLLGSGLTYTPQRNIPDYEPIAPSPNINNATAIPDPVFRSIVQGLFNASPTDTITEFDAANFTGFIYAFNQGITDLTGIEFFTGLDTLYVHFNALTDVDLSQNTALRRLFISNNALTSIDLSANSALEEIYLQGNDLASYTLPASAPIRVLLLHYNNLVDVGDLLSLTGLGAGDTVNIAYNDLDMMDSDDVLDLQNIVGGGLTFSPQNGFPTYEPIASSDNINDASRIPDPIFLDLVRGMFNAGPDDIISTSEALGETGFIYGYNLGLQDITGIEFFQNIDTLYAHFNEMTFVNLNQNTALRRAFLSYNDLTDVNLYDLTQIREIYLQGNNITSVTLPLSAPVERLFLHTNQISDIQFLVDYPGLSSLQQLDIRFNLLSEDDLANIQTIETVLGANFSYTVSDTLPPTLVAPESLLAEATQPGGALVTFAGLSATDVLDPSPVITTSPAEGSLFPIGTTIVSVTATDSAGFVATATIPVTVSDTQAPSLVCPDPIAIDADSPSGAVVSFSAPSVTDAADASPLVVTNPASGSLFPVGETVVSVTATDASGNQSTCSFTITVSDAQAPLLVCPDPVSVEATSLLGAIVNYPAPTATDESDPSPVIETSPASGTQFPMGETIVSVTATDSSGNQSFCSFTVTVSDLQPPVLTVPESLAIEANQTDGALVAYSGISATDAIDPAPAIEITPTDGSFFALGETIVSITATDAAGLIATATFPVTVSDTQAPSLVCPDPVLIEADSPLGAIVSFSAPSVSDVADATPTVEVFPASGSQFAIGETVVSVTATDASGNQSTCSFTITIVDTQAPSLVCPDPITIEADSPSGAVVSFSAPSVSDVADATPTVEVFPASGSQFAIGDTVVSVTATDSSGNQSFCSFTITVSDSQAPLLVCPDPISIEATSLLGAIVNYPTPTATDESDPSPVIETSPASGTQFPMGETIVSVTATDSSGNQSFCSFTVTVSDLQPPVLTVPESLAIEANQTDGALVAYSGISATDAIDPAPAIEITPTDGSFFALGETIVSVTATDAAGLIATATFPVTVSDTQAPSLVCPDPITIEADSPLGAIVSFSAPSVSDVADATPTVEVFPASGSQFAIGETVVSVTATDASGNQSTCSFTITIVDTQAPSLVCPDPVSVNASSSLTVVTYSAPTVSDMADPSPVVETNPASGSQFPVGVTIVSVTATDASGNQATCSFTVEVLDSQPPAISIGGPTDLTLESNVDTYNETVWVASAFDNVDGGVPVIIGGDTVDVSTPGVYIVTFDAVDQAGNPADQQTRVVTVADTLAPVFSGIANISVQQDAGCPVLTPVSITGLSVADVSDPAPTVSTSIAFADGSVSNTSGLPASTVSFPIGTSTVQLSAQDSSGNLAQESFTVTVQSRSFINVLALSIQSGVINYVDNTSIYVYDMSAGSCADIADGTSNSAVPSGFYDDVFANCVPDFEGPLNATGQATIGVYANTPYLVLLWIDADEDNQASAADRFVGRVINGVDCEETVSTYLIDFHYTLFASNSMLIQNDTQVIGDVAAEASITEELISSNSEVTMDSRSVVTGNIYGDTTRLRGTASLVGNVFTNQYNPDSTATVSGSIIETLQLALGSPVPTLPEITPGTNAIDVKSRETLKLHPGEYGRVRLRSGTETIPTVLVLTGGVYQIDELIVNSYSRIECLAPTIICVKKRVRMTRDTYLGPTAGSQLTAPDIELYVYTDNGSFRDRIKAMTIGRYSEINARIFAPKGAVFASNDCTILGRVISRWFRSGKRTTVTCDSTIETFHQ